MLDLVSVILVGSSTIWLRKASSAMVSSCWHCSPWLGYSTTHLFGQSISARLKSPPSQLVSACISTRSFMILYIITEAFIGGYRISYIPLSKQANIPSKLANIPIINFSKFSISLEVTKILNQVSLEVRWIVSYIPGSKMANILYP